jgi:hypothetical protein
MDFLVGFGIQFQAFIEGGGVLDYFCVDEGSNGGDREKDDSILANEVGPEDASSSCFDQLFCGSVRNQVALKAWT